MAWASEEEGTRSQLEEGCDAEVDPIAIVRVDLEFQTKCLNSVAALLGSCCVSGLHCTNGIGQVFVQAEIVQLLALDSCGTNLAPM